MPTAAFCEARLATLDALSDGISLGAIIGESGSGKTLLARSLVDPNVAFESDPPPFTFVWLPTRSGGTRRAVLASILHAIDPQSDLVTLLSDAGADGIAEAVAGGSPEDLLRLHLIDAAEGCLRRRGPVVVLVDEAERYGARLIDELRAMTNYLSEADGRPLFRVVLLGTRALEHNLHKPAFESVADRLGVESSLRPLNDEEAADYLAVQISRGDQPIRFEEDAVATLAATAPIVPGTLDRLARSTIEAVVGDGRDAVTAGDVDAVWTTFDRRGVELTADAAAEYAQPVASHPLERTDDVAGDVTAKSAAGEAPLDDETLETASEAPFPFAPLDGTVVEIGAADAAAPVDPLEPSEGSAESIMPPLAAGLGDFATPDVYEVKTPLASMLGPAETVDCGVEAEVVDPLAGHATSQTVGSVPTPDAGVAKASPSIDDTLSLVDLALEAAETEDDAAADLLEQALRDRDGGHLPDDLEAEFGARSDAAPIQPPAAFQPDADDFVDPNFACDLIRPASPSQLAAAYAEPTVAEPTVAEPCVAEPCVAVAVAEPAVGCDLEPSEPVVDERPAPAVPSGRTAAEQAAVVERGFGGLFTRLRRARR